jgi:hypothetical protein
MKTITPRQLCMLVCFFFFISFSLSISFFPDTGSAAGGPTPTPTPGCNAADMCKTPQLARVCNVTPPFDHCYNEKEWRGLKISRRIIVKNGIPEHKIGIFPMTDDECGCGRPTGIGQSFERITIPLPPTGPLGAITWLTVPAPCVGPACPNEEIYAFGIAVNGVVFDPLAAEWWQTFGKWNKNPQVHPDMATDLDCNMAHIQTNGRYHYHGLPTGLYESESLGGTYPWTSSASGLPHFLGKLSAKTARLGWAFDGAPVYGPLCYVQTTKKVEQNWSKPKSIWVQKTGPRPTPPDGPGGNYDGSYSFYQYTDPAGTTTTTGDYELPNPVPASSGTTLDECNGHFAPTPEYPDGIYHYHITEEYPYIPHCFHYPPDVKIETITDCESLKLFVFPHDVVMPSRTPTPTPSVGHTPPLSPMPPHGVTPLDRLSPKPKPTP